MRPEGARSSRPPGVAAVARPPCSDAEHAALLAAAPAVGVGPRFPPLPPGHSGLRTGYLCRRCWRPILRCTQEPCRALATHQRVVDWALGGIIPACEAHATGPVDRERLERWQYLYCRAKIG